MEYCWKGLVQILLHSKRRCLVFAFLAVLYIFWVFREAELISVKIANPDENIWTLEIPRRDRDRLDYLFRKLIAEDCFGYTLLGNKPMSLGAYDKPFSSKQAVALYQSLLPENLRTYLGWKTWEKYKSYFQSSNFSLWEEKNPWGEGSRLLVLVNKKNARKILRKEKTDFQKFLQIEELSLENLLEVKPLLSDGLKNHDALIGMLLGYGRGNAWLFYHGQYKDHHRLWGENTKEDELNRKSFDGKDLNTSLQYPSFVVDPDSEETRLLREDFIQTRQKIIDYYQGKDFLEATLSLLMGAPN